MIVPINKTHWHTHIGPRCVGSSKMIMIAIEYYKLVVTSFENIFILVYLHLGLMTHYWSIIRNKYKVSLRRLKLKRLDKKTSLQCFICVKTNYFIYLPVFCKISDEELEIFVSKVIIQNKRILRKDSALEGIPSVQSNFNHHSYQCGWNGDHRRILSAWFTALRWWAIV